VAHASIAAQRLQGKSLVIQKDDPAAIAGDASTEVFANPVTVRSRHNESPRQLLSLVVSKYIPLMMPQRVCMLRTICSSFSDYFSLLKVADFTIQAIILAALHNAFPEDRFIAEETSAQLLASGDATVEAVVAAASVAALPSGDNDGGEGLRTAADVCQALDLGSSGIAGGWSAHSRTWVLDPIDGTKGIM
jgi:hypothetical protein